MKLKKFDEDRKEKSKCIDQKRKCQKDLYQSTMGIFQEESKTNLSNTEKNKIYRRRKYEIEPIFGNLKAYLVLLDLPYEVRKR